jgi:hypothetical protein
MISAFCKTGSSIKAFKTFPIAADSLYAGMMMLKSSPELSETGVGNLALTSLLLI